jgi:hypothetical protein
MAVLGIILALDGTTVIGVSGGLAFALFNNNQGGPAQDGNGFSNTNNGSNAANGVNDGNDQGHERACQNGGPAAHNPHC